MNLSTKILLALIFGLVGGIGYSLSEPPVLDFLPALIDPVGTLWVNAIRMTVIPLLMALLLTAIADQHNGSQVALLGVKSIGLFIFMTLVSALLALIAAPPLIALLEIEPSASQELLESTARGFDTEVGLPPFRDWLVSLIPVNPFSAAVEGSILQL